MRFRSRAVFVNWPMLTVLGGGFFLIGTVVGSFLNVCIYRIPWQKSVIWPGSRCPRCLAAIAGFDNIPIVSWIALRGECRRCGLPISVRYPLVEAFTGLLFLGAYLVDVIAAPRGAWGQIPTAGLAAAAYHSLFLALLVAAALIDYDLMIIPDGITVLGMVSGIGLAAIYPLVRPAPAASSTHLAAFLTGGLGLVVGGAFTFAIRQVFTFVFRREAMGEGDVTLMGMIGAYLGWQAAILTFFLAAFLGLGHALWKLVRYLRKWLAGAQLSSSDREIPLGPYLSMAAALLFFSWPWVWPFCSRNLFFPLYVIFWWMLGIDIDLPG
jgi:leader peptidase (prepilin peptidase) / N-methyltransferase